MMQMQYLLSFMASNGLVAIPQKTVFLLLNQIKFGIKGEETVRVSDKVIAQSKNAKLLGK